MQQQGFYDLARASLSDVASSNCISQLLEDADVSLLQTRTQGHASGIEAQE